jgi:purine-binding chemotaxis protein CheW
MNIAETYILFELAGSAYGVRSREVLHIDLLEHITPVPNTASAVDGVVFSRGQVIPALNLRARFGFPRVAHTARTRLIFLKNEKRTVALIVDSAREFRAIPTESIRPIEETLTGVNGNYVRGVATINDRLVLLLDVGAVLTFDAEMTTTATVAALQPSA